MGSIHSICFPPFTRQCRVCALCQPGVPLLDPQTRAFSDLPAWLDRMEHRLKGRRLLMYW